MVNSPEYYSNELTTEYKNYDLILDEIQKTYPLYKINPKTDGNEYILDKTNYLSTQAKLFSIKNNLQNDSKILQNNNNDIIEKINNLEDSIQKNKDILSNLINNNNGASGSLSDMNYLYNIKLSYNIILGIVITISTMIYYKKYSVNNIKLQTK